MINIHYFTFGPASENTYILWDESKECLLIDPGNFTPYEHKQLSDFITEHELKPVRLLLTHGHFDHVNGNKYVFDTYGLLPEAHQNEYIIIENHVTSALRFNCHVEQSPMPKNELNEGDVITFGNNSTLEILFTPGHSPGSITFYSSKERFMVSGDVLFYGSIGRTDLYMSNHQDLIDSIKNKLIPLGDDMTVYCGHGQPTNIGEEKHYNMFLQ